MAVFRDCGLGVHYRCEGIAFGTLGTEGSMCDCSCHAEIVTAATADSPLPPAEARRWEVLQLVVKHGGYPSLADELTAAKAFVAFLETGGDPDAAQ